MAEHEISDKSFALLETIYREIANKKIKTTAEGKAQQESLMDLAELMWQHKLQYQPIDPEYLLPMMSESEQVRKKQGAQQAAADSSCQSPAKTRKVDA